MRRALAFLTVPLLAAAPPQRPKMKIRQATLTSGSGVEPRGPMPPSNFAVELELGPAVKSPEFRVWRVKAGDLKALERGASPRHLRGGGGRVEAQVTRTAEGTWVVGGIWPEGHQPEDRLMVEVWIGKRRHQWAVTALDERFRPVSQPRPGDEK